MDIVKAKKATEEAYKALEKTPEFKAYEKAWTWETLVKAKKALDEACMALRATPEYKAYLELESEENKYKAKEAYRATPAYEAFVKATETYEEVRVAYYKA